MQCIWAVVCSQTVALAIQVIDFCTGDAVCNSPNRLAEKRRMLAFVRSGRGKPQNNILSANFEFLNDATLRQENEAVGESCVCHVHTSDLRTISSKVKMVRIASRDICS